VKNIAIIPARSGSKALKDKNIKLLNDKPLIAYSIEAAIKSGIFSEIMVSTDSERYAEISRKYGANVPFLRSENTSGDWAGSWDVVTEVLQGYLDKGMQFDSVCLLQPTSPLRKSEDIILGYEKYYQMKADAVTAVCEVDHSPLWMMSLGDDGSLSDFRKNIKAVPRQKLITYYRINGALYIRKLKYDADEIKILCEREYAYIMDRRNSVDIDTVDDFQYASFLIRGGIEL
jgi:CMP-N,N'-diacetyllegionaminic acid synthase